MQPVAIKRCRDKMTVEQSFRDSVTLFRIDLFETAKISYNLPKVMKLGTIIPYLKKIQKVCKSFDTPLFFC